MKPPDQERRAHPESLTDLFVSFTLIGLQGFGGVVAIVQRELVEKKRWLTADEFVEDWAVAQLLPGPNVVNIALMVGARSFGVPGSLAAAAGILTMPLVLVLLLALVYARFAGSPGVAGALRGMSAAAAGLFASTGLKLLRPLKTNPLSVPARLALGVGSFVAIALLHWPLVYVLAGAGAAACLHTYRKLKP
ncbi:MAG: chromate transporter [Burkholderiaceae bacterium]